MIIRITMVNNYWYDYEPFEAKDICTAICNILKHSVLAVVNTDKETIYIVTSKIQDFQEHPIKY